MRLAPVRRYMLDTNTVSHLLKGHPVVARHVRELPMASLCISAITGGELRFGLAKRPEAKHLHVAVEELLLRVDVLPWDNAVTKRYGAVRADRERQGGMLSPLDLLIAAHALETGAVLVTNDRAFGRITELPLEDWTVQPPHGS
uniref:Ribonuclease VapC n=1 Tax=Candidatus Kentrum sp. DK TaxID=2126562 RepID=A0A450SDK0_9GAMM|nr:MAG: tRNA(fMet)-specific endonuclease VapC [Candidatus Kentron sp. DK]VFJ54577.1 MAG: tRNA(fMet)-specific endonuclease VapC [Candidatus Kentron sp. DK]